MHTMCVLTLPGWRGSRIRTPTPTRTTADILCSVKKSDNLNLSHCMGIVYPADLAPFNSLQSSSTIHNLFVGRRLAAAASCCRCRCTTVPQSSQTDVLLRLRAQKYSTWNICRTKNQQKRQKSKAGNLLWCRI